MGVPARAQHHQHWQRDGTDSSPHCDSSGPPRARFLGCSLGRDDCALHITRSPLAVFSPHSQPLATISLYNRVGLRAFCFGLARTARMRAITERARYAGSHGPSARHRPAEIGGPPWLMWWRSPAIRHGPQRPGEHGGAGGGEPLPAMEGWWAGSPKNVLLASGRVKENCRHLCDGGRNGERFGSYSGHSLPGCRVGRPSQATGRRVRSVWCQCAPCPRARSIPIRQATAPAAATCLRV